MSTEETKNPAPAEMSAEEKQIEQKMIKMIQKMPKNVQDRFKALKVLSDRRSQASDKHELESKQVSLKLEEEKRVPLYNKRKLIIDGETTDFAEDVTKFKENDAKLKEEVEKINTEKKEKGEEEEKKEEDTYKPPSLDHLKEVKGIPDFWHKALKNNQMFQETIKEKDDEALAFLKHVETKSSYEPVKTVTLTLHFRENPFFEDEIVTVVVTYDKDDDQSVQKIQGFPFKWKEGQDLSKKKIKKKQKNKKTGETRTIVKTVDSDSLFALLQNDREAKKMDKDEEPDSEEEENMMKIEDLQNFVEDINDIALPDCLEYYLNLHEDDMAGFGDEDDDDDDEDNDDEDGDEDGGKKRKKSGVSAKSGEEEEGGKKKKKGGKKGGKKDQEECKQQ